MRVRTIGLLCALSLAAAGGALAVSSGSDQPRPSRAELRAKARLDKWPKPIDEFLAGEFLQRSDVVLTRREYDPASYLIRWATGSVFSHSALIFTSPVQEPGINNTFVIEAGTGGVDLTNLADYVNDQSAFIAIKRLKQPWFDPEKQSRVRGLLLDNIKSQYDYWAIARIAREIWFGIERTIRGKEKTVEEFQNREWKRPNQFICSGLVQYGFVEAVVEYVLQRKLPPWALNEVVFSKTAEKRLISREDWETADPELIDLNIPATRAVLASDLEATTPEDLAESDKLKWLYFIQDGKVHKIGSYADLKRLAKL